MLTDFRYFKVNIGADINPFVHRNYPGFFKREKMEISVFSFFSVLSVNSSQPPIISSTVHQLEKYGWKEKGH